MLNNKYVCAMRKFTLLELLVVIAIIGILLTLLLPSLSRARYQTRIAVCASNLKQTATAFTSYSVSNDGKFPPVLSSFNSNPWTTYVMYESGKYYNMGKLQADGIVNGAEIFFCPQNEANSQELFTLKYNTNSSGNVVIPSGDSRARSSYHFLMENMGYDKRKKIRLSQLENDTAFLMDKLNHDENTAHNKWGIGWNFMRPDTSIKFIKSKKVWDIVVAGPIGTKWTETMNAVHELLSL